MRGEQGVYPSCSTCRYKKKLSYKLEKKRTDDGGINFQYIYIWKIDCEKEGKIVDRIEGTKHRAQIPKCSLWKARV